MPKRDRKRPYIERTFSRDRTISARKSAGTKRPRNTAGVLQIDRSGHMPPPPMNLGPTSHFHDIDQVFGSAPLWRVMNGHAPLARRYT